jgi:hypothetical protein
LGPGWMVGESMVHPEAASAVITPTKGVDPRDALATSLHASPGVYAILVGSGMSTAAGIKTTWGVVQDLIRRVATSEGVDPKGFDEAPEVWWAAQGRPELRYDLLLEELASTDTARRALLRRYFDPPPEEQRPCRSHTGSPCPCRAVRYWQGQPNSHYQLRRPDRESP